MPSSRLNVAPTGQTRAQGGIVVTQPVRARQVEVETRVGRFFINCLLEQADAFWEILPPPSLAGFPAKSRNRLVGLVWVWLAHVKRFLILMVGPEMSIGFCFLKPAGTAESRKAAIVGGLCVHKMAIRISGDGATSCLDRPARPRRASTVQAQSKRQG